MTSVHVICSGFPPFGCDPKDSERKKWQKPTVGQHGAPSLWVPSAGESAESKGTVLGCSYWPLARGVCLS
jgi:hypothetical protein